MFGDFFVVAVIMFLAGFLTSASMILPVWFIDRRHYERFMSYGSYMD